ncbi:MAG: 50S ribosomal protein L29 [Bacteroidetes bacterium]|nr:50S ribosomal protein L29 [Bacteroidota bacterium]
MEQSVINEMTTQELHEKISEEQETLAKFKLSHSISPLENPMKIRSTRRTVARLQSELSRRIQKDSSTK